MAIVCTRYDVSLPYRRFVWRFQYHVMAGTQYKDIPPEWRGDEQVGIARIPEFMISSVNQVAHV